MKDFSRDFPILGRQVNGHRLIYLDNAATTQMPLTAIEKIQEHYAENNSNVFRGSYALSRKCTKAMEDTREHLARFLNIPQAENIVWTSGATESIHLTAWGLRSYISSQDEILVSTLEHHSNFVPWQMLCREKNARLKVIPLKNGRLDMEAFEHMLNPRVRLVAVTELSNLTGEMPDCSAIIKKAHRNGSLVFIDGTQGVRRRYEIPEACDFYCMSAHKMFGPAGVGLLYGRPECLEMLEPVKTGGGMVEDVFIDRTSYRCLPYRLEAGTPNYPGIIALNETLNYIEKAGKADIIGREQELSDILLKGLSDMAGVDIVGGVQRHCGIVSFDIGGIDAYDAGVLLDRFGIAVRTGEHCAQPAMRALGKTSVIRASVAFYNSREDIDRFLEILRSIVERCGRIKKRGI